MSIVVFLGPSLAVADANAILDATYLPPAGQGDVYRAMRDLAPDAIGLVDGFFHQQPSVWHREILYALGQGVPVFGGASMGALRAAELADYGMNGVGRVFAAYRDEVFPPYPGPFDSDDEVAVIHGPAELGFPALSEALVDLRAAYAQACAAGVISASMRDELAALAASIPFTERSHASVLAAARDRGFAAAELSALAAEIEARPFSLKRADAEAVLRALADWRLAGSPPHEPRFLFEEPSAWRAFVAGEEQRRRHALSEAEEAVLDIARFEESDWDHLRRVALVRVSAAQPEPSAGAPALDEVRRAFDAWRRQHGLGSHASLQHWLAENSVDEAGVTQLFESEARHLRVNGDLAALRRAVVDELRLSGRFPALLQRARRKAEGIAASSDAARDPTALESSFLLDSAEGYRAGVQPGRSAEAERVRLAFDTQAHLFRSAWRHRCAVAAKLK